MKALLRNDHFLIKVYRVSHVMTAKKSTKKCDILISEFLLCFFDILGYIVAIGCASSLVALTHRYRLRTVYSLFVRDPQSDD